jgi:encapsulin shell SprI-like protein
VQAAVQRFAEAAARPQNSRGEADIAITSGHSGEPALPSTFADYELAPREYELSVAQTVLRRISSAAGRHRPSRWSTTS